MTDHRPGFCRGLLAEVMKDVRQSVPAGIIKEAWAYKYPGSMMKGTVEFHIPSRRFYWHGQGCCKSYAKTKGWEAYLRQIKRKSK